MTTDAEPRDLSDCVGPIRALEPREIRHAQLVIAARAHDAADARELLGALGIGGKA